MTIVFQGHVERVERGPLGKLDVHVVTAMAECGQTIVLHVPETSAAHWLPGRVVQITAYAFDQPQRTVKAPSREWVAKMAEMGDPPACSGCGAMAGVCSDYPNCPGSMQRVGV